MNNIKIWKLNQCPIILNEIIQENFWIIKSLSYKNQTKDLGWEDLIGIGILGLIKGLKKFCFSYNTKFSSYIFFWINSEIKLWKKKMENNPIFILQTPDEFLENDFVLDILSELEKNILFNRFVLKYSLRQIANILKISHEHIRRIQNNAITKLKRLL